MQEHQTKSETIQRPLIGVGAVVFRGDDVLLIKRGKEPFKGKWSIPGGRLEHGEPLEAAVKREVLEETGIEIAVVDMIGVFEVLPDATQHNSEPIGEGPANSVGGNPHMVLIDYIAEWVAGEPCAGDDASDAAFMPLEEALSRVSWDETRRAIEMAKNLRRQLSI